MSKVPAKHERRSSLPDLSELFPGFPLRAGFHPIFDTHLIRLEDEIEDGRYVLRAELPGIDPAKDVDITVRNGQLTIRAERSDKKESKGRSEFSYGSFLRSVTLPASANEDDIKASYDKRGMIPRILGRSWAIEAQLRVPESGAEGVLVANADFIGGLRYRSTGRACCTIPTHSSASRPTSRSRPSRSPRARSR